MATLKMYATPHRIEDEDADLDGYARGGVVLCRDSAHRVVVSLRNDAYEMRRRGGEANEGAANQCDELALEIGKALSGGK